MFWTYILPLIVSIAAVSIIHPQLVKIALRKHIVDEPNARKFQEHPVPTMGGIAVFFGIAVGMASLCFSGICSSFFVVVIAMLVMLYLGTIDDILDISPLLRMLIQVLTVLLLIYAGGYCLDDLHGLWGYDSISWYVAVPLTLISVVGIINAMNMIDGVDGLSSGLCMLYCLIFGVAFHLVGYVGMAAFAITAFGALLPFFMHNAFGRTSKMYIGNGGTMLMGILLSVFVMSMVRTDDFDEFFDARGYSVVPFTMAVLSIPVFDTLRVMFSRILHGGSPFKPDRTHLHHMFIWLGFSHVGTTFWIMGLDLAVVGAWLLSCRLGAGVDAQFYTVIVTGLIVTTGLYTAVKAIDHYFPEQMQRFIAWKLRAKPKREGIFLLLQRFMDRI